MEDVFEFVPNMKTKMKMTVYVNQAATILLIENARHALLT